MKLSKYEKETIILYNQAEPTASVYTQDPKLLVKLARLSEKYPQQIQPDGPNRYVVPQGLCASPGAVQRRTPRRRQRACKNGGSEAPDQGRKLRNFIRAAPRYRNLYPAPGLVF